jgi:glutathione S-transferase
MRLLYSANSPFVRKVMVVAHELRLDHRIEKVPTKAIATQANPALFADNPLGKIPVLVLASGDRLFDSPVIVEYLASLSEDGSSIVPASGPARWRALTEQALADGLLDAALLLRYEAARPGETAWPLWADAQREKISNVLDRMEASEPAFDIGWIASGCALGYLDFRFPELNWRAGRVRLAQWFDAFASRPSMVATQSPEQRP